MNYMQNGKDVIIHVIVGLMKRILLYKSGLIFCFLPYSHSKNQIEVELHLSNYVTKSDLKMQQLLIHYNLLEKMI